MSDYGEVVRARKQQIFQERQNTRIEHLKMKENKRQSISRERSRTRNGGEDSVARPNFYLRN